jgi:hypothetical protein
MPTIVKIPILTHTTPTMAAAVEAVQTVLGHFTRLTPIQDRPAFYARLHGCGSGTQAGVRRGCVGGRAPHQTHHDHSTARITAPVRALEYDTEKPAPSRFEREVREKGYLDEADVLENAVRRGLRRARHPSETRPPD